MSQLVEVVRLTVSYLLHISVWFALAVFITGIVDLLYLDIVAKRALRRDSRGWVGVVAAAAVGAFSPFCSFIVIPLIRRLLVSGVPLSAVMAFWIASPSMDPEIFALSASQIGVPLSTARLVGAVALSVGGGLVVLLLERRGMLTGILRDDRDERPALGSPVAGTAEDGPAPPAVPRPAVPRPAAAPPPWRAARPRAAARPPRPPAARPRRRRTTPPGGPPRRRVCAVRGTGASPCATWAGTS